MWAAELLTKCFSHKQIPKLIILLFLQPFIKQRFFFLSAVSSTTTDLDDLRFWSCLKSFQHSLYSCVAKWPIELRTAPIRVWWTLSLWRCHGGELSCKTRQLRANLESNHNMRPTRLLYEFLCLFLNFLCNFYFISERTSVQICHSYLKNS